MTRTLAVLSLALALAGVPASADDAPAPATVHAAIARGAAWLESNAARTLKASSWHDTAELTVLTLHHAGKNLQNETLRTGLELLQTVELRTTYRVSVLAMALSEINPRLYRDRLAHCAQWLVDTQLDAGEWGYPGSIQGRGRQPYAVKVAPPPPPEADEDADADEAEGDRPIEIVRREQRPTVAGDKGDFSNTQFAILGLRACRDAGIQVPKDTWKAALAYLLRTQRKDGGWGYEYAGEPDDASYASLTCAGLCSTAVCLHALGKRPASHRAVKRARAWLDDNLDPEKNVGIDRSAIMGPSTWQCYHLYSLERVGSVLRLDEVGGRPWYPAGASYLLRTQRGDGTWTDGGSADDFGPRPVYLTTADTCFAILFLAKATPPLTQ